MKTIILFIISSFILVPAVCQKPDNLHILLLERKDKNLVLKKTGFGTMSTEDVELNKIFKKHGIKNFTQCIPNAKIDSLKELYEIFIFGNVEDFTKEINGSQKFIVKRELEVGEAESCANPDPPVNDTWIVNGWSSNWNLNLIEANCAWSLSKGNSSIVIGIADSEFETTHEDLVNQFVSVTGPITEKFPHGTWVSGCCSPQTNNNKGIAGIGYNTKMAGYRVSHIINGDTTKCWGNPYSAIMQAYNDGRRVINVSWAMNGLTVAEAQSIVNSGTVLVLAAGNKTSSTNHKLIADIPGVINVSNVNSDNNHGPTNCARNQWVDFCAPGFDVLTTHDIDGPYPYHTYDYIHVWGTSSSAPHVCGTIGLMLAANSGLTPPQIENILKATCDPLNDQASFPGLVGAGRINAYCAVYNSIPLNLTGTLTGSYKRYLTNLNNASINSGTVNIIAAEALISGTFNVNTGSTFSLESSSDFSCD